MYGPDTHWELPFKNLRGEEVTAYRLRHLARQSKHPDMVMSYFADPSETENLDYWVDQMADLNKAFTENAYDQGGNAVYEVFRAGKRTHHWLFGHHAYLSTDDYSWEDQVESIRTFLHTAAQLAENGKKVRHGNHHTRGMVALFEIAATYPEYAQASEWMDLAVNGVTWHLENEVNADGFQFERTVHYHKSDIENFLRVWQLAKRGNIQLPDVYSSQFKKMFDALIVLAQPDKQLPVLQDDTDALHAETNEIADAMAIGTILWQEPVYGYFNTGEVSPLFYWLLDENDLRNLESVEVKHPDILSAALESTGYYVMRNGWELDDEYMVITAGLSDSKPDHQHADMLGVVAYANGAEILPNYQVKYNEPDFPFWKSSWVKNVALVDSIPQTLDWKGNSGGSGFGKWLDLPQPTVLASYFGDRVDYFCGAHDAYEGEGIAYRREVMFVKEGFWIVRDYFENFNDSQHEYQQIWQGLFKDFDDITIHRIFENGSSLHIVALDGGAEPEWRHGRFAKKGNAMRVEVSSEPEFAMTSLVLPSMDVNPEFPISWQLSSEPPEAGPFSKLMAIDAEWFLSSHDGLVTQAKHLSTREKELNLSESSLLYLRATPGGYEIQFFNPGGVEYSITQGQTGRLNGSISKSGQRITL